MRKTPCLLRFCRRPPELAVSAVCPHGSLLVNSIAMVKPEKAQMVENMLISMFQSGKLQGQVVFISLSRNTLLGIL